MGFDKLVLVTSPALDFQLSLHLWPSEGQNAQEDVHNHRFAFASVVLDGALEMETFERVEGGLHMREYESVPGEEIGVSRFRHVGDAALGCSFSARMPAGTLYHLSERTLHRITAVGDHRAETATLFLQGSIQQPSTSVLSDHSIGRRPTIVRPTMAPDLFAERVRGYIQELETTRAA